MVGLRRVLLLSTVALPSIIAASSQPASAQQSAQTSGDALNVPSYNPVDANGVDLLSGRFIVRSPAVSMGIKSDSANFYFQWSGRGWLPNTPRLWLDKDWHVIVEYEGGSDEFADAVQQNDTGVTTAIGTRFVYTQKRPNTGAQLVCYFTGGLTGAGWISQCNYKSRQGVEISFYGNQVYAGGYPPNALSDNEAFGNTRAWPAVKFDPAQGGTSYLVSSNPQINVNSTGGAIKVWWPNGYYVDTTGNYYSTSIKFTMLPSHGYDPATGRALTINTPSLNGSIAR